MKRSILFDLASILGDFEIGSLGYVWFPENMRENVRENIKRKSRRKKRFKINKLFLYAISNSFYLIFLFYVKIK